MCIYSKNKLLSFYYNEVSKGDRKLISNHVNSCQDCTEYLNMLNDTETMLNYWQDEIPTALSFDVILTQLPSSRPRARVKRLPKVFISMVPPLLTILFISTMTYLFYKTLMSLPLWNYLKHYWLIQTMGNFGIITLLILCIGIFFTLSLAPILLLEAKTGSNKTIKTHWRKK